MNIKHTTWTRLATLRDSGWNHFRFSLEHAATKQERHREKKKKKNAMSKYFVEKITIKKTNYAT